MINESVLETEIDIKEIKLHETHDLNSVITAECNKQGQIGYELVSTFVWNDILRLIFKLPNDKI